MIIFRKYNFLPEEKDLRFRVRWGDNIVSVCVNLKIDKNKWTKSQRCQKNTWHNGVSASEINDTLNSFERKADEIFQRFQEIESVPTKEEFRSLLRAALFNKQSESERNIYFFWDQFVKEQSTANGWSDSTVRSFDSIKKRIVAFNPSLYYKDITEDTLTQLVSFQVEQGYKNPTIKKTLSLMSWFLRWSERKGYYKGDALKTFKPRLKGVTDRTHTVIYLEWAELMKLYEYPFEQRYKRDVRDVFCFCCFTGLRYSDVAKLRAIDCQEHYINIVTQKTADAIQIELNSFSKEILSRHRYGHRPQDIILPVVSNQKMNVYLKEIGKEIGLDAPVKYVYFIGGERHEEIKPKWELLTTHCARRTFVVTALTLGIAPTTIMEWTGHADMDSMKPYIAIANDLKKTEMEKFDKKKESD